MCNAAGKPHANQTTGRLIQVTVKAADRDPQINTTLVDPKGATVAVWNDNNQPSLSPISDSDAAYTASVGTASVAFTLDGFGRMRVTTLKGQSQTITADYDTLGRQTELDDPDKGHWYYTNSALGHVLYQKDAKSNETTSAFDRLGRPLNRTTTGNGSTETANFYYYDTADNPAFHTVAKGEKGWIGAPQREECTATGSYPTTNLHYYDGKGRPSLELAQSDGKWFYTYSDYDAYSRVHQVRHYWKPAGVEAPGTQPYVWQDYGYIYAYDNRSYLLSLTDSQGRSWWDSPVYDYMDRVTSVRKGSGLTTVRTYRPTDGVLTGITTGSIQNLSFDYDGLGNLTSRSDALVTGGESLIYDNLNRLKTSKQGTTIYADNGNIMNKPDVAGAASDSYTYDSVHPHAVASAFGYAMTYDPNGNLLTRTKTGDNSYVKWAGFDKPRWLFRVTEVGTSGPLVRGSEFHYNAARSRVIQLEFDSVAGTVPNQVPQHYNRKRLYALGSTLELNYENRNTDKSSAGQDWTLDTVRIYVPGPDGLIGAREFRPGAAADSQEKPLVYHYDHLGTITAITTAFPPPAASVATDTTGKPGRFSEDAWGQRRNPFTWTGAPVTTGPNASDDGGADSLTPRGYTGHEMLDDLGLVHMNGRIYDPLLGRFLSADLVVQDAGNLQSYNRYSYVRNNPLSLIDPSGFLDEVAAGKQLGDWGTAGGALLTNMETQAGSGWTYKSFDEYTGNADIGTGSVGGVTSYGNKTVYLQDKSNMEDTLDDADHETKHATQTPFTTVDGRKANEKEAYHDEAQLQVDTGRSSKFTHTVDHKERVDDAAIATHVDDHYSPTDSHGHPLPGSHSATPGVSNDRQFTGVKNVDFRVMRLSYTAETSKIAAKAATKAANVAEKAAKNATKHGTPEERANAQKAAADAKAAAEQAKAAAAAAKKALEDELKRKKQNP